jgi:hypothetical protein
MGLGSSPPTHTATGFPDDSPDYNQQVTLTQGRKELTGEVQLFKVLTMIGRQEQGAMVAVVVHGEISLNNALRESFVEAGLRIARTPPALRLTEPDKTFFVEPSDTNITNAQLLLEQLTEILLTYTGAPQRIPRRASGVREEVIKIQPMPNPVDVFVEEATRAIRSALDRDQIPTQIVAALYRIGAEIHGVGVGAQSPKVSAREEAIGEAVDAVAVLRPELSAAHRAQLRAAIAASIE